MCGNGVTHKDLNAALGQQTAIIIATMRRSEDKIDRDIEKVDKRVTHIERRSRIESIIGSAIAAVAAIFVGEYTK